MRFMPSVAPTSLSINHRLKISFHAFRHQKRSLYAGLLVPLVCLATATGHAAGGEALPPITNLVIGGAEQRCSSFTGSGQSRNCTADWDTILAQDPAFKGLTKDDISFEAEPIAPSFTYSLTQAHVDALRTIPDRLFDAQRKAWMHAHLTQVLAQRGPQQGLTWAAFDALLPAPPSDRAGRLSLSEGAMLRSAFVDPLPHYHRKLQARSTLFTANAYSVAITAAFVAAARAANAGRRPLIGVVTASAGPHPFADRDINVLMLQTAGADVVYLPLEGGLRQALDAGDCAHLRYDYDSYTNTRPERVVYHADLLYPDLAAQQAAMCANQGQALNAVLHQIQGIYFSGGNQARHLESLVSKDAAGNYSIPSAQLTILRRRHAQGRLVVAGTSAGNHIQGGGLWRGKPVPMIGGGSSYEALKSGFATGRGANGDTAELGQTELNTNFPPVVYPLGGLGVFRFGVLDSHFSRRVREGRLVRAAFDSAMDYGFGVDENTALVVHQADATGSTHFSVLGAGGVFIADVRKAQATTAPHPRAKGIVGVRAHYLLPGDTARISAAGDLQVQLSIERPVLPATAAPGTVVAQDRLLDAGAANVLRLATAMGRAGAWLGHGTTHNSTNLRDKHDAPYYSATLSRDAQTVFRGAAVVEGMPTAPTAYSGLRMAFAPCDAECQP